MTDEEILALIRKEIKFALEKHMFEVTKKVARLERMLRESEGRRRYDPRNNIR